jgi:hypothetical protein
MYSHHCHGGCNVDHGSNFKMPPVVEIPPELTEEQKQWMEKVEYSMNQFSTPLIANIGIIDAVNYIENLYSCGQILRAEIINMKEREKDGLNR